VPIDVAHAVHTSRSHLVAAAVGVQIDACLVAAGIMTAATFDYKFSDTSLRQQQRQYEKYSILWSTN